MKTEDRSQTAPLLGTDRLTRPGEIYKDTVIALSPGLFNNHRLCHKNAIVEVLNDALDHQYFFVRGVEVDYRYVMTTSGKDLIDMNAAGELRRSEAIHG